MKTEREVQERQWAWFNPGEILCVLVTVSFLAAFIIPQVSKYRDRIRVQQARQELRSILGALERYKSAEGDFPSTREGLRALLENPNEDPVWNGPYLLGQEWPRDPWDRYYVYRKRAGAESHFLLFSLGPDGREGTQDDITA